MEGTFIELRLEVCAPPEKVWETLTSGAWAEAFFPGCRVESTWRPGALVLWRERRGPPFAKGKVVLRNETELRVVYFDGPDSDVPTDFVENYELLPRKSVCDLCVTVGPWDGAEDRLEWASETWEAAALKIKKIAEKDARKKPPTTTDD